MISLVNDGSDEDCAMFKLIELELDSKQASGAPKIPKHSSTKSKFTHTLL